jgi:hypothetical protein
MTDEVMWLQDLSAALHLENLFVAQQLRPIAAPMEWDLNPTGAETARAVASIRAWRTYLPPPCVQKMIDDGWQWST